MGSQSGNSSLNSMKIAGILLVSLAVTTLLGLAVLGYFESSGIVGNCTNATTKGQACRTIDAFQVGLAIFGTFCGVLVLGIMAKALIGMFKGGM